MHPVWSYRSLSCMSTEVAFISRVDILHLSIGIHIAIVCNTCMLDPTIAKERMELPICSMEQEIMEAINSQDVIIICGEVSLSTLHHPVNL